MRFMQEHTVSGAAVKWAHRRVGKTFATGTVLSDRYDKNNTCSSIQLLFNVLFLFLNVTTCG
jgi:hypothetical protein